ncbi:MAG TPA: hypothetical protein VGB97_00245 [Candidatus Paceibacterota bacterium]
MSQQKLSLRIEFHPDGDFVLCIDEDGIPIEDHNGNKAQVEFCSTSGGGGRSPHTREAIANLFAAILLDNRNDSSGIPRYPVGLAEAMESEA